MSATVVVIGAGPAGLAAACAAAESGARVIVVDDNPQPGGQIWRGAKGREIQPWLARIQNKNIQTRFGARVIAARPQEQQIDLETFETSFSLSYSRLILATGARELFLPFPGWTLPGVYGAGGLQALVKSGLPIANKRVVVAGSGPLLPAVAAYLKEKEAHLVGIYEQAPLRQLLPFAQAIAGSAGKLAQSLGFARKLGFTAYRFNTWIEEARGDSTLREVIVRGRAIPCDALAIGYGLVPNLELPTLLGCEIRNGAVVVDESQQTTVPHVYAAGEITGIGGVDKSIAEGATAGNPRQPANREPARAFAKTLNEAFRLRDELKRLPKPGTIVCRCEDVTLAQLQPFATAREAKLQTRCGMGPCQARICGPAARFLFGWENDHIRPPASPARIASLMEEQKEST